MNYVQNPTLESINAEVDKLWSTRVASIRQNNKELQPLVYSAWKLLSRVGRPKPGEDTFSSWLAERKIPRQTGYDILNRERVSLGEISVRTVQQSAESTDNGELDTDDAQETTVEASSSPVAASVASGDAVASTAREPHKTLTPAERKAKRTELETQLREAVGAKEAERIIDQAVIDHLTITLKTRPKLKVLRTRDKEFLNSLKAGESWTEAA